MTPGQVYKFVVDLWSTSNYFLPGHRIRVSVASSCYPRWDRNLNTGGAIGQERTGQVAINTIFAQNVRPSHIMLPIRRKSRFSDVITACDVSDNESKSHHEVHISDGRELMTGRK